MVPPQAALQTDQSQKQKRRGKFPRWILILACILALLFLIGGAIFWIWKVWGDSSNTLGAIFTALGTIFGFIALVIAIPPFFQYLEERRASSLSPGSGSSDDQKALNPAKKGETIVNHPASSQDWPSPWNERAVNQPPGTPPPLTSSSRPIAHFSPSGKRNVLDHKLHREIVQKLEGIPAAATWEGRNGLLSGIPHRIITSLNRDRNNDGNDLAILLTQLDGLGPLTTGEQALIIFIQNAQNSVEGFAVSGELDTVLDELKRRYEGSSQQDPGLKVNPPGPINITDYTGNRDNTKPSQNAPFLDWAHYYIRAAKDETKAAQSSLTASGYISPIEYTNKFNSLDEIKKSFGEFHKHIADTPQLPPEITLPREQLHVNVNRTIEQIESVQACIEDWATPCSDIRGKFDSLLQSLDELGIDCKLKD